MGVCAVISVVCSLTGVGLTLGPLGPEVAGAAGAGGAGTGSAGSRAATSTAQSRISAAETRVAKLETQISKEQSTLDEADELYNQSVVNLDGTRSALEATQISLTTLQDKLMSERAHLRHDAIENYIDNSTGSAMAQLFSAPTTGSQIRDLYEGVGAGDVTATLDQIQAAQSKLSVTRTKLLAEQRTETNQLGQENQTRQRASAANALSEATLAEVKGSLAQQIARQAAIQAAAAAKAAADASSRAAAQAAANQASEAAQVATTVSGGSGAAASATTSADQAGSSAGDPDFAYGGSPTAAGLAAVHAAMQYLGVPYEWGGLSFAGVDCSGLTKLAWANAGVYMPHSAADQYAMFPHVSPGSLEPGDLLFYDFGGDGIDHVIMYVGPVLDGQATPFGSGTIIQAAHTGTVVTFDPVWSEGFVGAAQP